MAETLVPKGLPHGERQQQVQARQFGDIPLNPPEARNLGQAMLARLGGTELLRPADQNIDLLQTLPADLVTPASPAAAESPSLSLRDEFVNLAATSNNRFLSAIALTAIERL